MTDDSQGHGVCDDSGGVGHGVQGGGGVRARLDDGFVGVKLKRSYWRKRIVPDGHVQKRINQFSPNFGEGGYLEHSTGSGKNL